MAKYRIFMLVCCPVTHSKNKYLLTVHNLCEHGMKSIKLIFLGIKYSIIGVHGGFTICFFKHTQLKKIL